MRSEEIEKALSHIVESVYLRTVYRGYETRIGEVTGEQIEAARAALSLPPDPAPPGMAEIERLVERYRDSIDRDLGVAPEG